MRRNGFIYTLEHVIEAITGTPLNKADRVPSFYSIFTTYLSVVADESYWTTGNGKKLFDTIFGLHHGDVVIVSRYEITDDEMTSAAKEFVFDFYGIFRATRPYYDKILEIYESKKNDLLKGIERESWNGTRFNDTPQNFDLETFDDDGHATNTNTGHAVETVDDVSVIDKIRTISESYQNVVNAWAKEFSKLFTNANNYTGDVPGGFNWL